MLTVGDSDLGTPEAVWLGAGPLHDLAPLQLPPLPRVVVVAPHPDDEVLGVGGLLLALFGSGTSLTFVAVTDGEASHPSSTARDEQARRAIRRREAIDAHHRLGVKVDTRIELGLPDGGVADHEKALTHELSDHLDERTLCLSPWRLDGHPDHDATGRAAAAACRRRGAALLEYPVWAWHWATPNSPGEGLPWARARRHQLDPVTQAAKAGAIRAFVSQIEPIGREPADRAVLPPAVLARFLRPFEVVFCTESEVATARTDSLDRPSRSFAD